MDTLVSVYLVKRLLAEGTLSAPILIQALEQAVYRSCSLVESLVASDVRFAYPIARCFVEDGDRADTSWRPDPRLILDLPPGLCERLLAFPFRERAGAVEVASVTPLERSVHEEFTFHLRRPVALFRGNLQALLAAAGAPVDLGSLTHSLSEPPPRVDISPIPLVRKSSKKTGQRERTRTSPGIGEEADSSPVASSAFGDTPSFAPNSSASPLDQLNGARDLGELAFVLSRFLLEPFIILEIGDDRLIPRAARPGTVAAQPIERWEESLFSIAADQGKYMGPYAMNQVHERFSHLFADGDLVVAERIGDLESGLVVVQKVRFDGSDDHEILDRAKVAFSRFEDSVSSLH